MSVIHIDDAEILVTERRVIVDPGTVVDLGLGWFAEVTAAGLSCGCNKGVLCPLNPQFQIGYMGQRVYALVP